MSLLAIVLAVSIETAPAQEIESHKPLAKTEAVPGVLIAQKKSKKRSKKGKGKGGRQRYLQGEARTSGSKTNIDFDEASIDGERRTPVGVQVGGTKQDHGYDLINLRLRWHPEMIKSTSNLETGKGQ